MIRPYISILIDGQEADMKEPMELHLTYAHIDLHNPTVVKNGFSKTIVFDGTPTNNRIFGCFGNMDRIIATEEGKNTGAYYNPSRKVDVVIMRNYEIIDRGYLKLDNVKKKGKSVEYHTTFYSGLGQFLYGLSYKDDGEQMKLSDLEYDYNLGFEVNKDTIQDAWSRVNGIGKFTGDTYAIYDFINFAPCYNGIPDNFSADKVAIDIDSFRLNAPELYERFTTSKDGCGLVNGWALGELKKEYDEWQMKDLRSYHQRPVIRLKEIIKAICNPSNNNGWDVELDDEFFNDDNPYYSNAWMTLPLLTEMEMNTTISNAEIKDDGTGKFTLSGLNDGDVISTTLKYSLGSNADVTIQSNGYGSSLQTGAYTFDRNTPLISANMAIYSQLVAYDANGNAVGGSNVISCATKYGKIPNNFTYDLEYRTSINEVNGRFVYEGSTDFKYRFWDDIVLGSYLGGERQTFELKLNNVKYTKGMYLKFVTKTTVIDNGTITGYGGKLFWTEGYDANPVEPKLFENWGIGEITVPKRGWFITKNVLLNSEHTPCDYLLGYLKQFNLHIWSDNVDKKIYIKLRKNYFTGNKVDINNLVDRDSEITITPIIYDAKWYNFGVEYNSDGLLNKTYKDNYGFDYGIQKVNTNYNFDSSSKDLLDTIVYKGAICQRAKSKYYVSGYEDYDNLAGFYLDGFTTLLFNSDGDTVEGDKINPKTTFKTYDWWKEAHYDITPKPDFRDKDGGAVDGANVLLFYNGKTEMKDSEGNRIGLTVSDDIPEFEQLNEGEPCWIWSYDWDVSDTFYYLPVFSRYLTNENGWVTHSWDFGTPKEIYIPDYNIDNSSDIYTQYWKAYIQDEYDMNTRQAEVKIRYKGRVSPDMLMDFVYFDGCYWRIAEIKDYNPCSQETTKTILVKVQDMNNFLI